jgi:hypothetical protein
MSLPGRSSIVHVSFQRLPAILYGAIPLSLTTSIRHIGADVGRMVPIPQIGITLKVPAKVGADAADDGNRLHDPSPSKSLSREDR